MSVLVIGSVTCDVSLYVDHLPGVEDDVNVLKQKMSVGGCAYNVANMLRLMNVRHQLVSDTGTGIFGNFVREELKKENIRPLFETESEQNGVCYTLVDRNGNRTFLAVHGAEYHFTEDMLESLDMRDTDLIWFCGLEIEESTGDQMISFLEKHADKRMFFSPGPRICAIPEERMKRILAFHPSVHLNAREGSSFLHMEGQNPETIVRGLHEKGFDSVVMTDGGNPVTVLEGNTVYQVPACTAHVIDGTGAGDSHIGTILGCLEKGKLLKEAVEKANHISAAVTECEGPVLMKEKYEKIRKELS